MLPLRRTEDLIVQELADETLIYDRQTHKAHCLNGTAAFIWRYCDGQTTIEQMAALLPQGLSLPADTGIVQLALDCLARRRLLQGGITPSNAVTRLSRRDLMRKLGVATVALPVVMTIFAPTAAAAASKTTSAACTAGCTGLGLPCVNVAGKSCVKSGRSGKCRCR